MVPSALTVAPRAPLRLGVPSAITKTPAASRARRLNLGPVPFRRTHEQPLLKVMLTRMLVGEQESAPQENLRAADDVHTLLAQASDLALSRVPTMLADAAIAHEEEIEVQEGAVCAGWSLMPRCV